MGRFLTLEPADLIASAIPQEHMRSLPTTNGIDRAWYVLCDRRPLTRREAIEKLSPLGCGKAIGLLNFFVKYGFVRTTGGDTFRVQIDAPPPSLTAQLLNDDTAMAGRPLVTAVGQGRVTDSKNSHTTNHP